MSRQKLLEEFPNMDSKAVERLFETHNRDYAETAKAIKEVYQSGSSAINVYTHEALQLEDEKLLEQVKRESLKVQNLN